MWLDLLIQNASKHDIMEIIPLAKGNSGRCHRAESGRIGVEYDFPHQEKQQGLEVTRRPMSFALSVCWNTLWWSRILIGI